MIAYLGIDIEMKMHFSSEIWSHFSTLFLVSCVILRNPCHSDTCCYKKSFSFSQDSHRIFFCPSILKHHTGFIFTHCAKDSMVLSICQFIFFLFWKTLNCFSDDCFYSYYLYVWILWTQFPIIFSFLFSIALYVFLVLSSNSLFSLFLAYCDF